MIDIGSAATIVRDHPDVIIYATVVDLANVMHVPELFLIRGPVNHISGWWYSGVLAEVNE